MAIGGGVESITMMVRDSSPNPQSISGAISTGTHGTGARFGGIADPGRRRDPGDGIR